MKYILLIIVIMLFLNNCTSPKIQQHNNKLSIHYNDHILIEEEGEVVDKNTFSLSHINIYQTVYNIKNNYITYEYIKATDGYRFTKGIKRSVGIIFNTNAYDLEYSKGNLYFFTLKQNQEDIYLIVENINSSALKLIYGLNKELYVKIKEAIQNDRSIDEKIIYKKNTIHSNSVSLQQQIKSKWSPKLIIMDQLVSKAIGRAAHGRR